MENRRRKISFASAVLLTVANMIGVGVFTTSGFALADLGEPTFVLLAWLIGGLLALCGALSYGALARRIPESGGEYTFLSLTVHPVAGFLAGWISLFVGFTAPIAAAAQGLQAYLAVWVDAKLSSEWVGTSAILAAGLVHGVKLRTGVGIQNVIVVLKIGLIIAFILAGAALIPANEYTVQRPLGDLDMLSLGIAVIWISFSYSGWNAAVYLGSEIRDPEYNLRRALVVATATVTLLYLALNAVFLYAAPIEAVMGKAEIGVVAAEALGGDGWRNAMSVLVCLALFTSISSMVMTGPRVYARMAEDGLFPGAFTSNNGVPRNAVIFQAAFAVLVLWLSDLKELLSYIGFTLSLSAAATVGGLIVLRHREGPQRVPVPGYPWIPGLFLFCTLAVAFAAIIRQPVESAVGLMTIATGLPVYWLMKRIRAKGTR